ncbi:hypothetical protein NMY22_g9060 [Coprinellus aureogranulatus]|nr:hypothetical protein NMY22_g9060 [Coprinellus aureogranulatus]
MQLWHGTADNVLNLTNLNEEVKQWTGLHGISQTATSTSSGTPKSNWAKSVYGTGQVESYVGSGNGHALPEAGTESTAITFFGSLGTHLLTTLVLSVLTALRLERSLPANLKTRDSGQTICTRLCLDLLGEGHNSWMPLGHLHDDEDSHSFPPGLPIELSTSVPGRSTLTSTPTVGAHSLSATDIALDVTLDVLRTVLLKPKPKPIGKTALHAAARYMNTLPYKQVKTILGSTSDRVYAAWVKRQGLPEIVEGPLVDEAYLYWIGPKRTDKVVLYVHGGAFFAPLLDPALSFWNYVRNDLQKQGIQTGFAVLGYGLYPESTFPTQLRQLAVVYDHLLALGMKPSDIHLVGDSAGGNLILQFLSQLLHPLEKIGPVQSIKAPLGGVLLISPWAKFQSESLSFTSNTEDVLTEPSMISWGRQYSEGVPESMRPYIEPGTAGPAWFNGLNLIVGKMLVTVGGEERLRDDVVALAEVLEKKGVDVQMEVPAGGVHADAFLPFLTTDRPTQLDPLTPIIVHWLKAQLAS